jgi:hypothetical protein
MQVMFIASATASDTRLITNSFVARMFGGGILQSSIRASQNGNHGNRRIVPHYVKKTIGCRVNRTVRPKRSRPVQRPSFFRRQLLLRLHQRGMPSGCFLAKRFVTRTCCIPYRDRKRNARNGVDRNERNGDGPINITRKIPEHAAVTGDDGGLIEVTDEQASAAWDAYGRATAGKPYPRNRQGGWHHPSKWPPGHVAEIVQVAIGRGA